jgi:hypothetical protein
MSTPSFDHSIPLAIVDHTGTLRVCHTVPEIASIPLAHAPEDLLQLHTTMWEQIFLRPPQSPQAKYRHGWDRIYGKRT